MPVALIIDDSPDLRSLLSRALIAEGIEVHTAENGKVAIETIEKLKKSEHLCMILLDIMMPVMNGHKFLEWKNSQPDLHDWPVVILTASTNHEVPEGAVSVMKKPVELDDLIDIINKLCKG